MGFRHRNILRALLTALVLALGVLSSAPAAAQTVEVVASSLLRSNGKRDVGEKPEWVSYADCVNDDEFTLPVNLTNFSTYDLEVWASTGEDCTLKDEREGTTASCWLLMELDPALPSTSVSFDSRDVVGRKVGQTWGSSGPEVCEGTDDNVPVSIYFILMDTTNVSQGFAVWGSGIDLLGPAPPTGLSAGVGEELLVIDWETGPADEDLLGFRFYCDPPTGSGTAPANAPTGSAGGAAGAS